MSIKLINEYNERQVLLIESIRKDRPSFVAKTRKKVIKQKHIIKEFKKLKHLKPDRPQYISQVARIEKLIAEAVDQEISNKYIRSYRTILDDLFKGGQVSDKELSTTYLFKKVRQPGIKDGRLLPRKVIPGQFYTYLYSPDGKDTLDYYDRLPMVLVLNTHKNGFTGLNLHLIDPESRLRIYKLMILFKRGTRYRTHLKIIWKLIKKADRFRMARPCIRRYKTSNILSKLSRVPVDDWEIMLLVPSLRFVGMLAETVYKENKKKAYRS